MIVGRKASRPRSTNRTCPTLFFPALDARLTVMAAFLIAATCCSSPPTIRLMIGLTALRLDKTIASIGGVRIFGRIVLIWIMIHREEQVLTLPVTFHDGYLWKLISRGRSSWIESYFFFPMKFFEEKKNCSCATIQRNSSSSQCTRMRVL